MANLVSVEAVTVIVKCPVQCTMYSSSPCHSFVSLHYDWMRRIFSKKVTNRAKRCSETKHHSQRDQSSSVYCLCGPHTLSDFDFIWHRNLNILATLFTFHSLHCFVGGIGLCFEIGDNWIYFRFGVSITIQSENINSNLRKISLDYYYFFEYPFRTQFETWLLLSFICFALVSLLLFLKPGLQI